MVEMFKPDYVAPIVGYLISSGKYCLSLMSSRYVCHSTNLPLQLMRRPLDHCLRFLVVGLLRPGGSTHSDIHSLIKSFPRLSRCSASGIPSLALVCIVPSSLPCQILSLRSRWEGYAFCLYSGGAHAGKRLNNVYGVEC